jgi:hypothetical protein
VPLAGPSRPARGVRGVGPQQQLHDEAAPGGTRRLAAVHRETPSRPGALQHRADDRGDRASPATTSRTARSTSAYRACG